MHGAGLLAGSQSHAILLTSLEGLLPVENPRKVHKVGKSSHFRTGSTDDIMALPLNLRFVPYSTLGTSSQNDRKKLGVDERAPLQLVIRLACDSSVRLVHDCDPSGRPYEQVGPCRATWQVGVRKLKT